MNFWLNTLMVDLGGILDFFCLSSLSPTGNTENVDLLAGVPTATKVVVESYDPGW